MSSNISKQGVLSTGGVINPNIIPNSYDMPLGRQDPATGTWRSTAAGMTATRIPLGNNMYGFQNEGTSSSYPYVSNYCVGSFRLTASEDYTMSFYARTTSGEGASAGFYLTSMTIIDGSHTEVFRDYAITPLTDKWKRCWLRFNSGLIPRPTIYIGITTGEAGETPVTTEMCLVKLELGSVLTPWAPNAIDTTYVGTSSGFTEITKDPIATIADNYVASPDFYEL